jgi:copper resistance protein C
LDYNGEVVMVWRILRRSVASLALSLVVVALWCAPALAHAQLLKTEPASGATVSGSTDQVRLRFNEPIDAEFSPLEVYDSGGTRVDEDDARVDPDDARVVEVGLEQLPKGSYTVKWRVTSVDGHVVSGKYGFEVTTGGSGQNAQAKAEGNKAQPNAGGNREQGAQPPAKNKADSGARAETGGSGRTVFYGVVGLGALVLVGLAFFGTAWLRRKA